MAASNDTGAVRAPDDAFAFGRNWQLYVEEYLNPERERIAEDSLRELLGDEFEGHSFLDIGAGSGLFSLCAHRLGAAPITSVDVDPDSVASCRALRASAGAPDAWAVTEGSILDPAVVERLDPADIVYSWGVLHHTGDMWPAIRNAASLVAPGGRFAIAIYNRVEGRFLDSHRWARIKRSYNHAPRIVRRAMLGVYEGYWAALQLRNRRNPFRVAAEYKQSRGMALRTDLIDWLGGHPYEFATVDEIVRFCEDECGFECIKVVPIPGGGTGNNQFVFRRPTSS